MRVRIKIQKFKVSNKYVRSLKFNRNPIPMKFQITKLYKQSHQCNPKTVIQNYVIKDYRNINQIQNVCKCNSKLPRNQSNNKLQYGSGRSFLGEGAVMEFVTRQCHHDINIVQRQQTNTRIATS